MKLFHTKSLLACDIPKSWLQRVTVPEYSQIWPTTALRLTDATDANDSRGFPLRKILRKENKLFSSGPVVKFYFWPADETQAKDDPTRIISFFS